MYLHLPWLFYWQLRKKSFSLQFVTINLRHNPTMSNEQIVIYTIVTQNKTQAWHLYNRWVYISWNDEIVLIKWIKIMFLMKNVNHYFNMLVIRCIKMTMPSKPVIGGYIGMVCQFILQTQATQALSLNWHAWSDMHQPGNRPFVTNCEVFFIGD